MGKDRNESVRNHNQKPLFKLDPGINHAHMHENMFAHAWENLSQRAAAMTNLRNY